MSDISFIYPTDNMEPVHQNRSGETMATIGLKVLGSWELSMAEEPRKKKKKKVGIWFFLALLPTLKERTELEGGGIREWRRDRVCGLTLSLVSICARFLWTILTMPGGWIQASPSTCTGTPSSPRMVIFTWRHWNATERKTGVVTQDAGFFFFWFLL